MVEPFFGRKAIENMRPSIQKIVDDCLDKMIKGGYKEPVDLVENFALPVPTQVALHDSMLSAIKKARVQLQERQPLLTCTLTSARIACLDKSHNQHKATH